MSAADTIRTVSTESGPVKYESDMPMGALRGFFAAGTEGDLEALIRSLASIVVEWPHKGDPSKAESWDALKRSQFSEVAQAISEDIGKLGEA